jgi:AraC-like DNA-binding protein
MPKRADSYFRYFAATADINLWGLGVTAAGFTQIPPHVGYPPARHPADHHFDWERGRVLDALQIVLITGGRGAFETRQGGVHTIETGAAFVLIPGVWHRYRPERDMGWVESWVEICGPLVDRLIRRGVFQAETAVRAGALEAGLDAALETIHARSRAGPAGFDAERAAGAFAALAAWKKSEQSTSSRHDRLTAAVEEAERYLADHHAEPVNIEQLARRLGVAYSHFRRAFKTHTGFAPWQYVLHLRLARAGRLMAASDATLDAIAAQVGFSSGFHLSSAFKQEHGMAPNRWRQELGRG